MLFENKNFSLKGIKAFIKKTYELLLAFLKQGKTIGVYAILLTLLATVSGVWGYSCKINESEWWCRSFTDNDAKVVLSVYLVYLFIEIYLLISASYDVYMAAVKKQNFNLKNVFLPGKEKLRYIGSMLIWFLAMCLPICVVYVILTKPANPNWRIEFWFFLITFFACWLPFLLLRFLVGMPSLLENGKLLPLAEVYEITKGRMASILLSLFLAFIVINFVNFRSSYYLDTVNFYQNYFVSAVGTEMVGSALKVVYMLILAAVIIALFDVYADKDEETEKDLKTAADTKKLSAEPKLAKSEKIAEKSAKKAKSKTKGKKAGK